MSVDTPLVSILMTAYNREKYIGTAIESVLNSTYTNFELIITDDLSKDNTVKIANDYAAKDARIKVFINQQNLGDYPNRNKAASYATGKYLKYVDADDLIYPWGIEHLVSMMEQFPDAGWGLCSLIQIDEKPYPFMLNPKQAYTHAYLGPGLFHKAPLSSIINKKVFDTEGGFKSIRMAGDFEMWNRLAQKHNVVLMPDGMVWYRVHNEQEMSMIRKHILKYEKITLHYLNSSDCPISKQEVQTIIKKRVRGFLKRFIISMLTLKFASCIDNLKLWLVYKFPSNKNYID